jgi:hypothetical protein
VAALGRAAGSDPPTAAGCERRANAGGRLQSITDAPTTPNRRVAARTCRIATVRLTDAPLDRA